MPLLQRIKRNRASLAAEMGRGRYRHFSASTVSRLRATERLIAAHARGRVLDVGCGHMPFQDLILRHADSYEGLDIEPRVDGVRYVTSATQMDGVPVGSFDTVLCAQVLEHVQEPGRVLSEIFNVLCPGGKIIATVPHLSRLHEQPHDYYRFTGFGLRVLVKRAGFEIIEIAPHAGLASFLSHQISTVFLGSTWHIPGLRQLTYQLNRFLLVYPALWVDKMTDREHLFALGYALVAQKLNKCLK